MLKKTTLILALTALACTAADVPAAKTVTAAELAAARASRPAVDEKAVYDRLATEFMAPWLSDGKVPGRVLFFDDFSEGLAKNWQDHYAQKGMIHVADDGRGGKCLVIPPRSNDFNCCEIKLDRLVPVNPTRPTALLWETRAVQGGNTCWCLLKFYDENKKDIRGEYQFRSSVDPTQPTLFQRNAHLVTVKMPPKARFLRVIFHHSPKQSDEFPGEIANVRVVDLQELVQARVQGDDANRRARAAAGEKDVLVYCADNLVSSFPVMPLSDAMPGRAGDELKVRECPGEKTCATAVLWSKSDCPDVTLELPTLGGTRVTAKIVKAHYQAVGAPASFVTSCADQVIVPELLLNDDSLVVPDHAHRRNLVKYQWEGTSWYVDINTLGAYPWAYGVPLKDMPIQDAPTLQPFDLQAGLNKQLVLRFSVPRNARPGIHRGDVVFKSRGVAVAKLPVSLEVLPFTLPEAAETVYDPAREFTMGLYTWATVGPDDWPCIRPMNRSRAQVRQIFETLVEYGVTDPAFVWGPGIVFDSARFRLHLELARAAGFPKKTLHLGASGHIGNPTEPDKIREMQEKLKKAMAIAKEYGFEEVFFYGFDEAKDARLVSQIPAWRAARAVGAKVMVSGYSQHFKLVGDYLDLCVYADDAGSANPADWHAKGARLWKYNTPQAGPEDPGIFRRNYGLDIWKRGYDGANTYCEMGSTSAWNDLAGIQAALKKNRAFAYRALNVVYPTVDGCVPTLELTGLESAIKDVRIATKFRQLLRAKPNAAAQAWFDALDFTSADLPTVRRALVDWILKLNP